MAESTNEQCRIIYQEEEERERESLDVVIYLWAAAPCDIYLRLGLER